MSQADPVLLAIDQGTTSSRAILFSKAGDILNVKQKELKLTMPEKGWVEQDATDIWKDTLWCTREILQDAEEEMIAAIGITNQRETTILWDRETGAPVYNAIVWQDRRTADYCTQLKEQGHEEMIREKTGLLCDPYFSATKIKWILDNVAGLRMRAENGEICFGTVDSFLLWHLTNGDSHATDITNASRTMLYNLKTQEWDKELLELFDIPSQILPEVKENCADFGMAHNTVLGHALPICGMAGDQHAALIGQACFETGMVKSTYGTGCFALMNIGPDFKLSENRLLTTVGYKINGQISYALEGSIFVAGALIQWLRDQLGLIETAAESEEKALSVPDSNGVYVVPAFTGLGAPYWEPGAQGVITGLTRESSAAHIIRAALEAQAYQTKDLISAFENDSGLSVDVIRADGGLVANNFVCQFLSDMLNVQLDVPKVTETTALGAAYLAGLQSGVYDSLDNLSSGWAVEQSYRPSMEDQIRVQLYQGWQKAVRQVLTA